MSRELRAVPKTVREADYVATSELVPEGTTAWFFLPATGAEVFSPAPLVRGRVYRISFFGKYRYWLGRHFVGRADARYDADDDHNLRIRHDGLQITNGFGRQVGDCWDEDRSQSRYCCLVDGDGKRLSFVLRAPERPLIIGSHQGVTVTVELLPESLLTLEQQQAAEALASKLARQREQEELMRREQAAEQQRLLRHQAAELARQTELDRQRAAAIAEEQRKNQEGIRIQVGDLKRLAHHGRNMCDPKFRLAFAEARRDEILQTLASQWSAEYNAVFANTELVAALKQQAPEVLEFFESRLGVVLAAERLAVGIEPSRPAPKPKVVNKQSQVIPRIRKLVQDLFDWQAERDGLERDLPTPEVRYKFKAVSYRIDTALAQLRRYGIVARCPEEAEAQFERLYEDGTGANLYQTILHKLASGEAANVKAVVSRLYDLQKEEDKLIGHRHHALRLKNMVELRQWDEQLMRVRRDYDELYNTLSAHGIAVNLKPEPEPEQTFGDRMVGFEEGLAETIRRLESLGLDPERIEFAKAIYAQQLEKELGLRSTDAYQNAG